MIVTVFRARMRAGLSADLLSQLEKHGARMYELASGMPGFVSYKDFAASDGEGVSIVEFESAEQVRAWRDHPEHKEVQRWGRELIFSDYQIQVCELLHGSRLAGGTVARF